jgi:hypothetical protein
MNTALSRVLRLCSSTTAGSERFYAREILRGVVNHSLVFDWLLHLASGNGIDRLARRDDIQRAARAALSELAPKILVDSCAAAWHEDANKVLVEDSATALLASLF